jgi:hypothetical protein
MFHLSELQSFASWQETFAPLGLNLDLLEVPIQTVAKLMSQSQNFFTTTAITCEDYDMFFGWLVQCQARLIEDAAAVKVSLNADGSQIIVNEFRVSKFLQTHLQFDYIGQFLKEGNIKELKELNQATTKQDDNNENDEQMTEMEQQPNLEIMNNPLERFGLPFRLDTKESLVNLFMQLREYDFDFNLY